jgi:predicted membrane protein
VILLYLMTVQLFVCERIYIYIYIYMVTYITARNVNYCKIASFTFFFLSFSNLFYLFIVGAEGYCYTWLRWMTHTHVHTHTRASTHKHAHTLGSTPLDEASASRRDHYLTIQYIHNRQAGFPPAGFEHATPARERPPESAQILYLQK